ncbi:tetratricopeptide repeat protein [Aquiflexum gelatinilyticum]|uniref:Tetratricopeptide repeat protein n=1 Tax=Aquiflexum gelatinilyticum TaxID=2961943 RepID=A0A9X2T2M7_9BACT|nr:tetratricopeptide repeat protein [Aquiflexum gelatinilyticum]MCR9015605.1 tetratricopeptide repeat protein [Aquiflexum gelatinilyticum]
MRKSFILFLILWCVHNLSAQTGLYQSGKQVTLDDNFELFNKHLFSGSRFEYEELKNSDLNNNQQVLVDFYHSVSALKIENPGSTDLVNHFIRNYPNHPKKNEAAFILGSFYFDRKNYREAIPAFQKIEASAIKPEKKSEIYFKTGYSYFLLKDFKNALNYFNQVKVEKGGYSADAYYYAGFISKESGNYDQAIKDFKEAEKASFYASKVPYMLAGIYYQQGYFDELIAYAEPVLKSRPNLDRKEEIHLFLAEAYFEKRNFAAAAQNYDLFVNARKRDLDRSQVYKAGVAQFETGNFQRASDYFKVSAVIEDEIGQVSSYYLGHAYLKLNNPQFASTSFNAAYKNTSNPNIREDALVNFAKVNLERGSFQEAVNALDAYLDNYPNGIYANEAENLLTDALINTNNYLRAIEHIEKMSRKSERLKAAYQKITFYQGLVYYRDKKHDLATNYFDKSLASPIDKDLVIQAHFWKGENFAATNRSPQAIKSYETLQSLKPKITDPYLVKSYYGLGYTYFNLQQYTKAENQFRQYVDKGGKNDDPDKYDEALVRLGDVYFVQKKFTESQSAFQRAINEGGSSVDYAYFRSGVVFNFQNRNTEAISQLDRLISGYPNSLYFEDAIYQKSQINMEESRYADAREGYSSLISSRPNSQFVPFALEGRAVANFSLQNYDQTIEDYKRILQNHPNSSNAEAALVGLQEALALQGRSEEFSQYLGTYRNANPDNKSLQNLEYEAAKNLYFSNSFDQAINAFLGYLKNYPQSANRDEANYFIADAHYKLGQKEKALEYFYLIEKVKASTQRIKAVQRIAALEMEQSNYKQAIGFYREAINYSRNKIEEFEVFSGLMNAYYQTQKFDSAGYFADRVVQLGSVTQDAVPEATLLKAKSQREMGKETEADETLMELINEYKTVHGAEGLFLLAEGQSQKQNYEQSNNTIFDFSGPFFPYDYWYGRCFILLADNYLKLDEVFQAKATLESILENSNNDEVKEMANKKLAEIK